MGGGAPDTSFWTGLRLRGRERHPVTTYRMAALGVHFSLTDAEVRELESRKSDDDRLEYVQEEIEQHFFENREQDLAQTHKAWDAIHRCLTDGTLAGGTGQPLEIVILGGRALYSGDSYIMTLKNAAEVRAAAPLLDAMDRASFRAAYDRIDTRDYGGHLGDDDFEYTWEYFVGLREFWHRAAAHGRNILFTADQ